MDVIKTLSRYRRPITIATLGVTALMFLTVGAYYLWLQPRRTLVSQQFRPTFKGSDRGEYPNGLTFSPVDITSPAVLDRVYADNNVQEYCARDPFVTGFYVETTSPEVELLDAEYRTRLNDPRLTQVDRDRLQREYLERRNGLGLQYRLSWMRPSLCKRVPVDLIYKALPEVLQRWADEIENARGVLNVQVPMLTANTLDIPKGEATSVVIFAERLHKALREIIATVDNVQRIGGADLIRIGEKKTSLAEIRNGFDDLVTARLDPLITAGGADTETIRWIEETLKEADAELRSAEERGAANLTALREYSGLPQTLPRPGEAPRSTSSGGNPADVQALTPQIDRTFVDRIIDLSTPHLEFRQELSREMVKHNINAVSARRAASHYQRVLESLRRNPQGFLPREEVEARLQRIVADAKKLTNDFNALYEEFSRLSLRAAPSMYRIERPPYAQVLQPFNPRTFWMLVVVAFFVSLVLSAIACLVHARLAQTAQPVRV